MAMETPLGQCVVALGIISEALGGLGSMVRGRAYGRAVNAMESAAALAAVGVFLKEHKCNFAKVFLRNTLMYAIVHTIIYIIG
jgi:hypothetical protein